MDSEPAFKASKASAAQARLSFAAGSEKTVLCMPVQQQVHQGVVHSLPDARHLGRTSAASVPPSQPRKPPVAVQRPVESATAAPRLHVRILCAHGLRNMDIGAFFGNKSDPYVVVRFGNLEPPGRLWRSSHSIDLASGDEEEDAGDQRQLGSGG